MLKFYQNIQEHIGSQGILQNRSRILGQEFRTDLKRIQNLGIIFLEKKNLIIKQRNIKGHNLV
jgi:hypothetical protein